MNYKIIFFILGSILLFSFIEEVYRYDDNEIHSFIIDVNQKSLSKLKVLENNHLLDYEEFISQIATKNNVDTTDMFLTNLSVVDLNCSPMGLFYENGRESSRINLSDGSGNFFLKPNGVIVFTDNNVEINESSLFNFKKHNDIKLAFQSGPLLLNAGEVNSKFNYYSKNINNRLGVGIYYDSDGKKKLIFAYSSKPINFYSFAKFFKDKYRCEYALCLESGGVVFKTPNKTAMGAKQNRICKYFYFSNN